METVSIITICYNCKDSLLRTVQSVISQNYSQKEYIIVDGGSTDGSMEAIAPYREHIDQLLSERDDGIYDALNKGIRMSHGEWVVCMNAGDVFASPDILSQVLSEEIPKEVTFLYSDYWMQTADGGRVKGIADRDKGNLLHQSCIYRRCLHEKYGYYLVTHPYIVSDLLFFLSVPAEQFKKVPVEISINDEGGVSQQGLWSSEGALALKTVFHIESLSSAWRRYMSLRLRRAVPYSWRRWIRKHILPKHRGDR